MDTKSDTIIVWDFNFGHLQLKTLLYWQIFEPRLLNKSLQRLKNAKLNDHKSVLLKSHHRFNYSRHSLMPLFSFNNNSPWNQPEQTWIHIRYGRSFHIEKKKYVRNIETEETFGLDGASNFAYCQTHFEKWHRFHIATLLLKSIPLLPNQISDTWIVFPRFRTRCFF